MLPLVVDKKGFGTPVLTVELQAPVTLVNRLPCGLDFLVGSKDHPLSATPQVRELHGVFLGVGVGAGQRVVSLAWVSV